MSDIPKSCSTCEHRSGARCGLSGNFREIERKYPDACGRDFAGWVLRIGFFRRVKFLLLGEQQ
jgi:hypothetical protein